MIELLGSVKGEARDGRVFGSGGRFVLARFRVSMIYSRSCRPLDEIEWAVDESAGRSIRWCKLLLEM